MPRVNPEVLRWARETAGLSPAEAAKRIALSDTKRATSVERIAALEAGTDAPSRALLARMAKQYRRPLVAFYLAKPPRKGDRGQDFRTLPENPDPGEEALLDALVRDIRARQGIVRAALENEPDAEKLDFIGSISLGDGVGKAVEVIHSRLSVSTEKYRSTRDSESAFKYLRGQVEALGVYVLLVGNLGSHHSALSVETFRGLAIADALAPFIVINDQDSRAAWSFSLIHEFTHLLLGQTGISGGRPDRRVEQFCDSVASEFLLPRTELIREFRQATPTMDGLATWISDRATAWKVSRTMVAYRLLRNDLVTEEMWRELRSHFRDQWLRSRERRKELARAKEGGPSYYVVKRQRLGDGLLGVATRMLSEGVLSTSKVARVLSVKPTNVGPLLGLERPHDERGDD